MPETDVDLINDFMAQETETEDETTEEDKTEETEDETTEETTETDDKTEDDKEGDEDEDEDDDYFTEPETPAAVETPKPPAEVVEGSEDKYVLDRLAKIPVNVVVAGADGKDVIQSVQVYGNGDLPAGFKGFATPLEGENYRAALAVQIARALDLRKEYKVNAERTQVARQQEEFTQKENRAIAEDLTELRTEGLFPKFKGTPGTREFNQSEGAKEFDKTVAFMNKKNDEYVQRANQGKSYRHIGFREAYEMMHGQNPKAAEQAEDKARKAIAAKTRSGRGADSGAKTAKAGRVSNLNDLSAEFMQMYPESE